MFGQTTGIAESPALPEREVVWGKLMNARIGAILAALAVAAPLQVASGQDAKKGLPANPVGISPWSQTVSKDASVVGEQLDKKQLELVQRVNGYFNQMGDMKGLFVQTSADNKRSRGKFYVKRPGRFRFDYGAPSKLVIISDGQYLAIQDLDLKTDDRVALDNTPFRVLMRKDVDLLRDARILLVHDIDDVIVLSLEDRNTDNPGRIKLFLAKKPTLELKEWITTDPQGLDTRVELHEMSKADDLDPNLFKPSLTSTQKVLQ
jgi:outer membrane lipoprotein-sorting protein